jgi:hypothetical protein
MNPFSNVPRRIVVTVIASALVLVVAAATALGRPKSTRVDPTSKWRWCRCKVVTLFSTRLIPYLSRTTSETKG